MNIWVTKYALTTGIEEHTAEQCGNASMVKVQKGSLYGGRYFHGKDWHFSYKEAVEHAETMRVKKIESLKKQIKKLESLKF